MINYKKAIFLIGFSPFSFSSRYMVHTKQGNRQMKTGRCMRAMGIRMIMGMLPTFVTNFLSMFGYSHFKKDPKLSNAENILEFMRKDPEKEYLVSEISNFVGYEAGTRIGDLCRRGLVLRTGTKIGENGQRFALYSLVDENK